MEIKVNDYVRTKEIEELLNYIDQFVYVDQTYNDIKLSKIDSKLILSHIEQLENNRDKAINYTDITIELIEQQPTEDDTWIIDRLKGFKNILRGDSE